MSRAPGPIQYFGGKAALCRYLATRLPRHKRYREPFAGGARLFFFKEPTREDVLNDINSELMTFYRVLQNHPVALLDAVTEVVYSREEFDRLNKADWGHLTDIQQAAAFLFLQQASFACKPKARSKRVRGRTKAPSKRRS